MSTGNFIYTNAPINLPAHLSIFSGFGCAALNASAGLMQEDERAEQRVGDRRRDERPVAFSSSWLTFPFLKRNFWREFFAPPNSWKI